MHNAAHAPDEVGALLDRVAGIREELDALERGLTASPALLKQPEELALGRLFRGTGLPTDTAFLRVPLEGSRVAVLRGDDAACRRLRSGLEDPRRRQLVRTREDELTIVVYPGPRPTSHTDPTLRLAQSAHRLGAITVGVSPAITQVRDLAVAYSDASDAADLAYEQGTPWVMAEEQWVALSHRRLAASLARCLPLNNPVRVLAEHDQAHATDFLRTVGTWLDLGGDAAATAKALSLHVNTVRYRLRRAEVLGDLDLTDARTRALFLLLVDEPLRSARRHTKPAAV